MKEMQLLMAGRYHPYINCHRIENLLYLFENRCLITLEGGQAALAYCLVWMNPYNLIVLGPFSVNL